MAKNQFSGEVIKRRKCLAIVCINYVIHFYRDNLNS